MSSCWDVLRTPAWVVMALLSVVQVGWSDCNCRSSGTVAMAPQMDPTFASGPQVMDQQFADAVPYQGTYPGEFSQPGLPRYGLTLNGHPQGGLPEPASPLLNVDAVPGTNRYGLTPPPGTLSQTYQRRTTLMPDDKHPRDAMVEVYLPENVDVTARGLKPKWTGEVWQLATSEPLLPGRPHIYAIRADWRDKEGNITKTEVRWVRLIMGRVVELEF